MCTIVLFDSVAGFLLLGQKTSFVSDFSAFALDMTINLYDIVNVTGSRMECSFSSGSFSYLCSST